MRECAHFSSPSRWLITRDQQKQDHYHKIRRSNYLASLRLEGFDTQPTDVDKPLPTREAVLAKYRNTSS